MTALATNAWWCNYCTRNVQGECEADVPWYGSSTSCKYWKEDVLKEAPPLCKKFNLKKILVETF